MPNLVNPPTYITVTDFKAMPLDYDLSSYSDAQLLDVLRRATGSANAILKKSLLAAERTQRFRGTGTSRMSLHARPLLYLKQIQFVFPGLTGQLIPLDRVDVDYEKGVLEVLRSLLLTDVGYRPYFPEDVPIDITFGSGYGFNPYNAPTWSATDGRIGIVGLAPGTYPIGVTTRTQWGETQANIQQITTASGAIALLLTPALGAYSYRVYAGSPGTLPAAMSLVGEIPSATFTDGSPRYTVSSLATPAQTFPQLLGATDTSAPPMPEDLREAVRLLAMLSIYEQNNLANRGVARTSSGRKQVQWRSTEGSSGRGTPLYFDQAIELLRPLSLQEIY